MGRKLFFIQSMRVACSCLDSDIGDTPFLWGHYSTKREVGEILQLSKELYKTTKFQSLEGKEDLRFELFDWLKGKGLTARQAIDLLDMTRNEIIEARRTIMNNLPL